jgi:hypothetical protein
MATPRARSRPATADSDADAANRDRDRDSNMVRASVLDAALQLGLGTNAKVANWLFNPVPEEHEDEEEAEVRSAPCFTFAEYGIPTHELRVRIYAGRALARADRRVDL